MANRRKSVRCGISRNFEAGNLLEISTESISNPCVGREGTGLRYQSLRFCHYREHFSNLVCRNSNATIVGFPENKKQQRLVLGEKKAKKKLRPLLLLRLAQPPKDAVLGEISR